VAVGRPDRKLLELRSERLRSLPPYLFEELTRFKNRKRAEGADIVDLSIGDPDTGAPPEAVEALRKYAGDRRLDRYTPAWAVEEFNESAARYMRRRYSVDLDPACEIAPVIGTKEGLANLSLAVVDPGSFVLVPDPGYPVYLSSVGFAGGEARPMPLTEENDFIPDLRVTHCREAPRMVFLNYPNNPTSAVAGPALFDEAVEFGRRTGACIVNDAAYSEITFDGYVSPSILEVEGAREVAVEFHSFSKTYGVPGWRVGFAAGRRDVINALKTLKSNIDSGVPGMMLLAARDMLDLGRGHIGKTLREYAARRALLLEALDAVGIGHHKSPATLYVWAKVPGKMGSVDFARLLVEKAGVIVAPGIGFGSGGEGYFRLSLTCPRDEAAKAGTRIKEVSRAWKTSTGSTG
jgi:LL-diaminopimelate aminotransferase